MVYPVISPLRVIGIKIIILIILGSYFLLAKFHSGIIRGILAYELSRSALGK